jgi:hypothetical protein
MRALTAMLSTLFSATQSWPTSVMTMTGSTSTSTINNIQALYENLTHHFGPPCDPDMR